MRPLLKQQDRPTGSRLAVRNEHDLRCLEERRILGPVDEPGQVEVVTVRPAGRLRDERGHPVERDDRAPPDVEHNVVRAPREPEHSIVLGRRHREAVHTDDVLVEAGEAGGRIGRHELAPQLGPEAATKFTPPMVVLGSRSDEIAATRSRVAAPGSASNSR